MNAPRGKSAAANANRVKERGEGGEEDGSHYMYIHTEAKIFRSHNGKRCVREMLLLLSSLRTLSSIRIYCLDRTLDRSPARSHPSFVRLRKKHCMTNRVSRPSPTSVWSCFRRPYKLNFRYCFNILALIAACLSLRLIHEAQRKTMSGRRRTRHVACALQSRSGQGATS